LTAVGLTGPVTDRWGDLEAQLTSAGIAVARLDDDDDVRRYLARSGPRLLLLPRWLADYVHDLAHELAVPLPALIYLLHTPSAAQYAEAIRHGAFCALAADAPTELAVLVVRAALLGHTLLPAAVARALARHWPDAEPGIRRQA
jgi:DNA-binding NarL/FixJ family response regulator